MSDKVVALTWLTAVGWSVRLPATRSCVGTLKRGEASFSVSSMTQHSNLKQTDHFGQHQYFAILQVVRIIPALLLAIQETMGLSQRLNYTSGKRAMHCVRNVTPLVTQYLFTNDSHASYVKID